MTVPTDRRRALRPREWAALSLAVALVLALGGMLGLEGAQGGLETIASKAPGASIEA